LFLTSASLTRRTTIQKQDTTKRIPEHCLKLKHLYTPQRPRQTALEGLKKKLHLDHIACLQASAAQCREVSPELWLFQWEKTTQRGQDSPRIVSHFVRTPALISHHGNCRRICGVQPRGILLPWRKGEGIATTSPWIMTDEVHICSAQVVILISGFAHLQNQVRGLL